ncbi:MAG: zinc ribbon domain-containing protein [Planctomycetales bacterium]
MPNWPGGPCPSCGEDMPENLIHCMSCRALLNPELEEDSVEVPSFFELQELSCMIELKARGFFIKCPKCSRELRINRKYAGETVSCKHCNGKFEFDPQQEKTAPVAYYGDCPHCQKELRLGKRYAGMKVACKFCHGKIEFVT